MEPSEPNEYFNPDHRLSFTFPDGYDDTILRIEDIRNRIKFGFDFERSEFANSQFDEDPNFAVAVLYLAKRNSVRGLLGIGEEAGGAYFSMFREAEDEFDGLRSFTNQEVEFPGFPKEKLFVERSDDPQFFIYCRPSGNDYPSFCTLTARELLRSPDSSNATLLAEITFEEHNLSRWREIMIALEKIVSDHGEMVPRDQAAERED